MTPASSDQAERRTAPALWLVAVAVLTVLAAAALHSARLGVALLVLTLVATAVARLLGRGRRPAGLAVRSTWVDVLVLLALAVGMSVLAVSPGV